MAAGRGAVCRTRSSGRQRRCGGGIHSPEPGATRCGGGRMPAGRRLLGPLPRMRPVRARCAGRLVPCREVLRKRSGGAHVAGRAGARNGCGYPRGCGVGTSAGECLPHLRDSSASRRPDGGELPAPSSLRPRPHSALPAFSAQSFAAGRHTLRPDMRFAAARAEATKRRRGRPEARGLSDESRPPPSSVPPAIREFSRRGGSRRVDKTCRTASARRPERSTPRGCSLRPRPARRPEALRAIWLRRRTPPRLRADRA